MAQTRHVHMLMEPADYERLEAVARSTKQSVAELVRTAVRERYLAPSKSATSPVDRLQALELDLPCWDELAAELAEAKAGGLS